MAALEVLALDESTPRIRAPGAGDTYTMPRALALTGSLTLSADAILWRDAANTLALRNSTNAQTFNVYNTYTDASNYERLAVKYSSNIAIIEHEAAGTGNTNRTTQFKTGGTTTLTLSQTGAIFGVQASFNNNTGPIGIRRRTAEVTSTATESNDNAGSLVTNRGASGTITRTLLTYVDNIIYMRIAAHAFRIKPSSGKSFRRLNGTLETADKYLELGSTGASIEVVYDGTEYVVMRESGTITVEP